MDLGCQIDKIRVTDLDGDDPDPDPVAPDKIKPDTDADPTFMKKKNIIWIRIRTSRKDQK